MGLSSHGATQTMVTTVVNKMKNVQQIQATEHAFAAGLPDGSIVTWGQATCGGDSTKVQDQLKNM